MTTITTTPQRIRRERTKGWRAPQGAVYVGRPTRYGNPFGFRTPAGLARVPGAVTGLPWEYEGRISAAGVQHDYHHADGRITRCDVRHLTRQECVDLYRAVLLGEPEPHLDAYADRSRGWRRSIPEVADLRADLRGRNLMCWCPIGQPCHADVLLDVVNA